MAWTKINKPTSATWSAVPNPSESSVTTNTGGGDPIGLLLALTYTLQRSSIVTGWTEISKPSTFNWTTIPKPAS